VWSVLAGNATINDNGLANPNVTNLSAGQNIFIWTVQNGNCIDADTVEIVLLPPNECFEDIDMPTGITPNSDGINDYFVIKGLDVTNNKFNVYNRWGVLVYEKVNYKNDWDGKTTNGLVLPDGTYYVVFKSPNRNATLKGYVDLRR
jgi:gliding motility-associated-like protein